MLVDVLNKCFFRVAHCTLHLIENNPLELKWRPRIIPSLKFQPVPLLPKILILHRRKESHITVNRHQIPKILSVLRRKRIHGEITPCPRIHICIQASLQHLHEWVPYRVLLGATRRQVLQDMGLAGVVIRWSPEEDREHIIQILGV